MVLYRECVPLKDFSEFLNFNTPTIADNDMYIDSFIESETDYLMSDCCELVTGELRNKGQR